MTDFASLDETPIRTLDKWHNINWLIDYINKWAESKGWNKERSFADDMNLFHTEISEAYEEHRKHKEIGEVYYSKSKDEQGNSKPEGIAIEIADLAIRIFHFCAVHHLPLGELIRIKMAYNETRPERHGGKRT